MNRERTGDPAGSKPLSSINALLQAQLEALTQIEAILGQEHEALENRSPEALLAAADSKHAALSRLGELENERRTISADIHPNQLEQLREIADRCRALNRANSALLNTQRQHVTRLLSLLRGDQDARPAGYDATGQSTGNPAQQLRLTQV